MGGTVEGVPRLKPEKQSGESPTRQNLETAKSGQWEQHRINHVVSHLILQKLIWLQEETDTGNRRLADKKRKVLRTDRAELQTWLMGGRGGKRFMAGSFTEGDFQSDRVLEEMSFFLLKLLC